MSKREQPAFSRDFWRSFNSLGIYSKEDGPLLSDQEDAGVAGGANSSDDKNTPDDSSETNEQYNDVNLDSTGTNLGGGFDDFGGGGDTSTGEDQDMAAGGPTGAPGGEPENPNENPFKDGNGKSLLDSKLAELQSAITDTLQRVYVNPKIDTVVVSEMETLNDSVRNIRETIYTVPSEQSQYKYRLAALSYAQLSKQLVTELQAEIKNQ